MTSSPNKALALFPFLDLKAQYAQIRGEIEAAVNRIFESHEYRKTLVKKGSSTNATVVCRVTIGKYTFIGAGAVVTRDVPDYALVVGNPARQVGWMCYCGIRLQNKGPATQCSACGRAYAIKENTCGEISGDGREPTGNQSGAPARAKGAKILEAWQEIRSNPPMESGDRQTARSAAELIVNHLLGSRAKCASSS